jgi:DNA ligase-1
MASCSLSAGNAIRSIPIAPTPSHPASHRCRTACTLNPRSLAHPLDDRAPVLLISPAVDAPIWDALAQRRRESRARLVEGLMLKRLSSPYHVGRRRGDWWKWKIDPYAIDAVLIDAQAGHGRRATLHTDYTFAVCQGETLVPVAKAYSGLSDDEIDTLDRWIRQHTIERYGPVRAVEPVHVFELAFEGLAPSTRHRAGIALRFPRIACWRTDKTAREADTLERVKALLQVPCEPITLHPDTRGDRGRSE